MVTVEVGEGWLRRATVNLHTAQPQNRVNRSIQTLLEDTFILLHKFLFCVVFSVVFVERQSLPIV